MARLVVPGYPHHVTQRGNRRQTTFFGDGDYQVYIDFIVRAKADAGVDIRAYCLMPNHVHLIVVPKRSDSLAALFARAHRRYTRYINRRNEWRGHLWQERFHSCVMDERHLITAVRYVEQNPVEAGLCGDPSDWPWSSTRAHLAGTDDDLVAVQPMLTLVSNWRQFLSQANTLQELEALRQHCRTGRPLGEASFVDKLELVTGRKLKPGKPGPKRVR